MKLERKHLIAYADYNLKVIVGNTERDLTAISLDSPFMFVTAWKGSREKQMVAIDNIKPILRPLDLTKEIEVNGEKFVPHTSIENLFDIEDFDGFLNYLVKREDDGNVYISLQKQYQIIQKLHEWHFDTFGLIDAGLAIDINKV